MPKNKIKLKDDAYNEQGVVIGFICSEKSYKVAWLLNQILGYDLQREAEWKSNLGSNVEQGFDLYLYHDALLKADIYLLKNKQEGRTASKIYNIYDYLLCIFGETDVYSRENWITQLSNNNMFSLVKSLQLKPFDIKF